MSVRKKKPYNIPKRTVKGKKDNYNKNFDVTTRIRVDEVRLNDSDSLDTSFLEGRVERQSRKDTKKVKEKILKDNSNKIKFLDTIKRFLFGVTIITCIVLLSIYLVNYIKSNHIFDDLTSKGNNNVVDKKDNVKKNNKIDDNYLLVGDYNIDKINFEDFDLDYHYVKSTNKGLTTRKLVDNMNDYVYKYNPSIVFLQVGIYDLNDKTDIKDIISNYEEIIDNIRKNRSYADICVESLIPINRDSEDFDGDFFNDELNNDDIKEFNLKLKTLAEEKKVTYIDLYSMLESDGKLDEDYSDDGIHLNDDGYRQMLKMVKKYTTND